MTSGSLCVVRSQSAPGWLSISAETCQSMGASVPVPREGQRYHSPAASVFLILPFPSSPLGAGDVSGFFSYPRALGQIEKLFPSKLSLTKPYLQSSSKLNKTQFRGRDNCTWPSLAHDSPKPPVLSTFSLELNPRWGGRTLAFL